MNSCGDGVLHPPAPVSVHGDWRERYTAYQYRESVLFRDEAHGQQGSSCVFRDHAEIRQKNASYRRSEDHKRAPYLPKILQMKPKGNEYGTSPRTHQQHRNSLASAGEAARLRSPAQGPTQGPAQAPKVLVSKKIIITTQKGTIT